jgi:hypothetical protein
MPLWLQFIAIILLVTVNDVIWTLYISYISEKKKYPAAFAAMGITIGNGLVITQYIHEPRLLIGCVVGAFIGVVLPMTYNERKKANEEKESKSS